MRFDKKISRREVVKKVGSLPVLALVTPPFSENPLVSQSRPDSNGHGKAQQAEEKIFLNKVSILVDPDEPTYVQHALGDLRDYLQEQTASSVEILSSMSGKSEVVIAAGRKAALQLFPDEASLESLPEAGFQIRSVKKNGKVAIAVSGKTAEGTNYGLASLMSRIRLEEKSAYLKSPLNITSSPKFRMRGIHLNGWPLNNPYSFRTWQEKDWQHFIDMAWLQRANLFFLWPFMEIMPVPLSPEDEAYLQEVRRVVDYAQKRRGMKVWIMQSANRVAVSNCGVRDTKSRLYWMDSCQKDMNPADPEQVKRIMQSFETLYRVLDNADGFCMIDSDPGGWPQSPIADQIKIFQGARKLLDEFSLQGKKCELIDWMWVGWGRHKFYSPSKTVVAQYDWSSQNPDASDLAFMEETIRNFKQNLEEPWSLIAGFSPYLKSCRNEKVLEKTIYLPYGAIEVEPAFPNTRVNLGSVRNVLEAVREIPEIRGIMGNNQTPLLQLPRTFFFLNSAWDFEFRKRGETEVMGELAEQLYPKHKELIRDCFLALDDTHLDRIEPALNRLQNLLGQGNLGPLGILGRKLYPDPLIIARSLVFQLRIRATRQRLILTLTGQPSRKECETLVGDYLDSLLAWSDETGWKGGVIIGTWRGTMYESDRSFTEAMSILKRILGGEADTTSYGAIASFFQPITQRLLKKYGEDEVMMSCVEPLKLAVIQAP